jgi:hypothetical protein
MKPLLLLGLTVCLTGGAAGAGDGSPMPAVSSDFSIASTPRRPPARCAPDFVARRLIAMLRAYNSGRGHAFALFFGKKAQFHAYTGSTASQLRVPGYMRASGVVGQKLIARFVSVRHRLGDGWTLTRLLPPRSADGPPGTAVYGVSLRVRRGAAPLKNGDAKVVLRCSSAVVTAWIGPAS